MKNWKHYNKFWWTMPGVIAALLTGLDLIGNDQGELVVQVLGAILTSIGVYRVPNAPKVTG